MHPTGNSGSSVARGDRPSVMTPMEGTTMKKIDIAKLPELPTSVGIHGSSKQKEVGGAACVAAIVIVFT